MRGADGVESMWEQDTIVRDAAFKAQYQHSFLGRYARWRDTVVAVAYADYSGSTVRDKIILSHRFITIYTRRAGVNKLRIGRQTMVLERGTPPKRVQPTCSPRRGLQSCWSDWAGVTA